MSISKTFAIGLALTAAGLPLAALSQTAPKLGTAISEADVAPFDLTILPSGANLPAGSGSVAKGAEVYADKCESCHGLAGAGGSGSRLSGGIGSLASDAPIKTVSSFWPSATTVFDYVRRAMPINEPKSLTNEEVYAVTAYVLSIDGIVAKDAVMDARSLPKVVMPNHDGFVSMWPDPTLASR